MADEVGAFSRLRDPLRAIGEGITFGYGDEVTGALGAAAARMQGQPFGETYRNIRDAERYELARQHAENPWGTIGGEVGGGLLSALLTRQPMGALAKLPGVAGRTLARPVTQGAALGAVAGTGAAEEVGDMPLGGLGGALLGAGAAGLTSAAGSLLGKFSEYVKGQFGSELPRATAKKFLEALRKDQIEPSALLKEVEERAASTGKPVSFADILSEKNASNALGLVKSALRRAPEAAREVVDALEDRIREQGGRVAEDVATALGSVPASVRGTLEEMVSKRAATAKKLYQQAFKGDRPLKDENLLRLFETKGAQHGLKAAVESLEVAGEKVPTRWATKADIEAGFIPESLFTGVEKGGRREYIAPTLKLFDRIKQELYTLEDRAMAPALTPGSPAKTTPLASAYRSVRQQLTEMLDDPTVGGPAYSLARSTFAGQSEMVDAALLGTKLFKMDPRDLTAKLAKMSEAERDAMAQGFTAYLTSLPARESQDFARSLVRDTNRQATMKALIPPEEFQALMQKLGTESTMFEASRGLMPATGTMPGPRLREMLASATAPGWKERLMGMVPSQVLEWPSVPAAANVAREMTAPGGPAGALRRSLLEPILPSAVPGAAGATGALSGMPGRDPYELERLRAELEGEQ